MEACAYENAGKRTFPGESSIGQVFSPLILERLPGNVDGTATYERKGVAYAVRELG